MFSQHSFAHIGRLICHGVLLRYSSKKKLRQTKLKRTPNFKSHLQSSISRLSVHRLQSRITIAILSELIFPCRLGIQLGITNRLRTRDMAPTILASMLVVVMILVQMENVQISSTTRQLLHQPGKGHTRIWIGGFND
jgi:hypothetical protein